MNLYGAEEPCEESKTETSLAFQTKFHDGGGGWAHKQIILRTPEKGPRIQLNSDTVYSFIESDSIG